MKTVRAVYGNGIFRPLGTVELPEGSVVEFEPRLIRPGEPAFERTFEMPRQASDWKPRLQEFDPAADFEVHSRNLPHWRQEGATYFVTFRLGDALPRPAIRRLRAERLAWLRQHTPPVARAELRRFQELFSEKIETYLAAGYGACQLKQAAVATLVEDSLRHFDGQRYSLGRYVVMPNHVHLLVLPHPDHDLSAILHSWKSYSSKQINTLVGRHGAIWQQESFDHIVRNEDELWHYARYIEENPLLAHLPTDTCRLGCGSLGLPSFRQ